MKWEWKWDYWDAKKSSMANYITPLFIQYINNLPLDPNIYISIFLGSTAHASSGSSILPTVIAIPLNTWIRALVFLEWNSVRWDAAAEYGPLILKMAFKSESPFG